MTVRYVICDFCAHQGNFTDLTTCPKCRKTLCKRCSSELPARAGQCAKRESCPEPPPEPKPNWLGRILGAGKKR